MAKKGALNRPLKKKFTDKKTCENIENPNMSVWVPIVTVTSKRKCILLTICCQ